MKGRIIAQWSLFCNTLAVVVGGFSMCRGVPESEGVVYREPGG